MGHYISFGIIQNICALVVVLIKVQNTWVEMVLNWHLVDERKQIPNWSKIGLHVFKLMRAPQKSIIYKCNVDNHMLYKVVYLPLHLFFNRRKDKICAFFIHDNNKCKGNIR